MKIHKFKFNDKYIILDINSSYVYDVDKLVYDILDYYETLDSKDIVKKLSNEYKSEDIIEGISEIDELKAEGLLFTKEEKVNKRIYQQGIVKAMCLHVSHDCNLACRYCFAGGGDFHMQREVMDIKTAKKALDFLIENSAGYKNLEVDFFGGEPLLNFDVVKEAVEYGRKREKETGKNFRFTLTTNAVLLDDEIIKYLNENMYNVVLSLDGRKEINDYTRPTRNGKGSYDVIIDNIIKTAKERDRLKKDYYIRGTYTAYNPDFYEDIKHFSDIGLKNLSIEAVVAKEGEEYALTNEHLPKLLDSYDKLTKLYLERKGTDKEFNFFHFNIDIDGNKCEYKRVSGCGSGCEYIAVTPKGDIYPCHQFVGDEKFIMGNLDDGIVNNDLRDEFYALTLDNMEKCKNCFAKYFCGGGCHANSYNFTGRLDDVYDVGCELLRKRIECSLYIKCVQKEQEA